jgi:fatty-acyl-CoA synthase/long-chain acyl-CoA synthetase
MPVGHLLVRAAARYPARRALVFPDESHTYADLLAGAWHTARGLHALGVRPGDHVGILMPNCGEYVEALFGVCLLGCVVVPLNVRYKSEELAYVFDHAELTAILTTDRIDDHVDFTKVIATGLPSLAHANHRRALRLPEAPRLTRAVLLRGPSKGGFIGRDDFASFAATASLADVQRRSAMVRSSDTAAILYTSGTTAHPKGCMLSHEAISRGSVGRLREHVALSGHDVFWSGGPLFHIASLQLLLGCFGTGGTYLTDTHFVAERAAQLMLAYGVTIAWPWFPAIIQELLAAPSFDTDTVATTLRSYMLIGPPVLLRSIQALFPMAEHLNACGMTETAGAYAISARDDTPDLRQNTGGRAVSGMEVKIVDPTTGAEQPRGESGELLVRGYCLMQSYYKDPVKTAEALDTDGWFHTQDLYIHTATGHLLFNGRLKDMMKVGGENVAAVEVEAFLCEHPAVKLAEVVGMPDPRLDEVPIAFVELTVGHDVSDSELIDFCRGRIANYKVPRAIHFVESGQWPMSATKVDKNALRRRLAGMRVVGVSSDPAPSGAGPR